jgi:hypothetical protein
MRYGKELMILYRAVEKVVLGGKEVVSNRMRNIEGGQLRVQLSGKLQVLEYEFLTF